MRIFKFHFFLLHLEKKQYKIFKLRYYRRFFFLEILMIRSQLIKIGKCISLHISYINRNGFFVLKNYYSIFSYNEIISKKDVAGKINLYFIESIIYNF